MPKLKINQTIEDIRNELKIINDEIGGCQKGLEGVEKRLGDLDIKMEGMRSDVNWGNKISWYALITGIGIFVSVVIAIIINAIK